MQMDNNIQHTHIVPEVLPWSQLVPHNRAEVPVSLADGKLLFFGGRGVPLRRYEFFLHALVASIPESVSPSNPIVLSHSIGIIRALVYLSERRITARLVVSLDGSDIDLASLAARSITDTDANYGQNHCKMLSVLIEHFTRQKDIEHLGPIVLFRWKDGDGKADGPYTRVEHYESPSGHHGYNDKQLRKRI